MRRWSDGLKIGTLPQPWQTWASLHDAAIFLRLHTFFESAWGNRCPTWPLVRGCFLPEIFLSQNAGVQKWPGGFRSNEANQIVKTGVNTFLDNYIKPYRIEKTYMFFFWGGTGELCLQYVSPPKWMAIRVQGLQDNFSIRGDVLGHCSLQSKNLFRVMRPVIPCL